MCKSQYKIKYEDVWNIANELKIKFRSKVNKYWLLDAITDELGIQYNGGPHIDEYETIVKEMVMLPRTSKHATIWNNIESKTSRSRVIRIRREWL